MTAPTSYRYDPRAPALDTRPDAFALVPWHRADGRVVLVFLRALIAAGVKA